MEIPPAAKDLSKGLTSQEASWKLEEVGPNKLPEAKPPSAFSIFLAQLKSPLVYVLIAAGVVTFILRELADTLLIFLAVFVNTILGFLQERKAGQSLEALKKLVNPQAKVIRDSEVYTLGIEEIVPGDVVVLHQGDKVPADGLLLSANRFYVSEAVLTGESASVEKMEETVVFMGTVVVAGVGRMLVQKTGARTEIGKIAQSVSESELAEETPLRKQLTLFSRNLSFLVLGLTLLVFIVGLVLGEDPVNIFTTSVALAVSAVPEGLLVGLTVVLAIGMQRILAKKGLVRNLVSAETLGGVTTICTDKTGTLTQGKMRVVNTVGDEEQLAVQITIANDLDDPVVIAAWEWGNEKVQEVETFPEKHFRFDSLPFSSSSGYFASLNKWNGETNMLFVNGAPEILIARSLLSDEERTVLHKKVEKFAEEGKRIIGFARKPVPVSQTSLVEEHIDADLEFVGLLAFSDPIRVDVKEALQKTLNAGIKLIVITGDYAKTALSVLKQLDLPIEESTVISGSELLEMDDAVLEARINQATGTLLFARTKPDQKLKIIDILKRKGEVVAMMGDGVNDAPALSRADIGIVVGDASDVAKESADLILLDSSFATIVSAIEEGRGIFDNIRKIMLYLMSDAFIEILIVIAALVFRFPLPISAVQILWVNLVSDGFPNLALTVDPKAPGIMRIKPRSSKEPLVSSWMLMLMAIVSVTGGVFAFGLFLIVLKVSNDPILARSVAFATVGTNSLTYVFSIRTLKDPFWRDGLFDNKWLIGAVIAGVFLQILPFSIKELRSLFGIVPLNGYWVVIFAMSLLMFLAVELAKPVFRKGLKD